MRVATRLRLTFGALFAILGVVVAVHLATMRRAVDATRELTAVTTRQQSTASQRRRLDDMVDVLRKYGITNDAEYLERLAALVRAHDGEIRALELQRMSAAERSALRDLTLRWDPASDAIDSLIIDGRLGRAGRSPSTDSVAERIDLAKASTEAFAAASRFAMLDELRAGDRRAATTQRFFWASAVAALLLVAIAATFLVQSIIDPLERLASATRAVARGELGARVSVRKGVARDDELAVVTRDFNEMSTRLEQLDRMKRDFISNVSHDLKSPLAAIQETNDLLLDGLVGPLGERQQRLLEMSRDSGRRLSSMIYKLLDLSRLDARPTPIRDLLDLYALTEHAVEHMNVARNARGRGPVVILERSPHLLLRADAEEISQMLHNLLENAVKFSPDDGAVRVALSEEDGFAVLRVADEGPGVPDDEKHRIFERFYQADVGRSAPDHGVGLGLAICRHVVNAHGGTISVRDNTPSGAVFEARIPGAIMVPPQADAPPLAELFA